MQSIPRLIAVGLVIGVVWVPSAASAQDAAQPDALEAAGLAVDAERGDSVAQLLLGHRYADGRGVAQDDGEAAAWYRRGAEQGDAEAQFFLGVTQARGTNLSRALPTRRLRDEMKIEQGCSCFSKDLGRPNAETHRLKAKPVNGSTRSFAVATSSGSTTLVVKHI